MAVNQLRVKKTTVAKNGMVKYRAGTSRGDGSIYFSKEMFDGEPPAELIVHSETNATLVEAKPKPERKAKAPAGAEAPAGQAATEASAQA